MVELRRKFLPCRHCEGRGEVYASFSSNPSVKARWHSCPDCGGTGCSPYFNTPEIKVEDEDDERV